MSERWRIFTEKLKSAGYTLEDLADNESLFRLVVEEICDFSPQQVNELLKEWRSYRAKHGVTTLESPGQRQENGELSSLQAGHVGMLSNHPVSLILARASAFLRNLSNNNVQLTPGKVSEISLSRSQSQAFRERVAALHKPGGGIEIMWKFCGPKTIANIKQGRRMVNMEDFDTLCPSGIVLYRDNGAPAPSLGVPPMELRRRGWALVACDTVVGKSRRLEEEEIAMLEHFPIEDCFSSLDNDGYDSIRIVSRNAFVFFHPSQCIPRFVVELEESSENEADPYSTYSHGSHNVDSTYINPRVYGFEGVRNGDGDGDENGLQKASRTPLDATMSRVNHSSFVSSTACPAHPGKQVEFWCPREKKLLCSHCLFYDGYSKDNCVLVTDAIRTEASRLEQWVQNAGTFINEIGGVMELFHSAERDVDRCEAERKAELRETFKRLYAKIHAMENEMMAQVASKSKQQRETLKKCMDDIHTTVESVRLVVREANGPLSKHHGGVMDYESCVAFLRLTQTAFGDWKGIHIPMYSIVSGWNREVFKEIEACMDSVRLIESDGQVELPEAVDLNNLKG